MNEPKNIRAAQQERPANRNRLLPSSGDLLLNAMLGMHAGGAGHGGNGSALSGEWAQKEVLCARAFNFETPEDPVLAAERMRQAVRQVMRVNRCVILSFDERTGIYKNLLEADGQSASKQETPCLSDDFLREWLNTEGETLHMPLIQDDHLIGLVAVADKRDGSSFHPRDQILLELLARYLAGKVAQFLASWQAKAEPQSREIILALSERLLIAVDQDAIITATLETFVRDLGFDVCQYVGVNEETGDGEVLYEIRRPADGRTENAKLQSYSHAGQKSRRRTIREFSSMVSLLTSLARNRFYLHLNGKKLGNRSLMEIFGVRGINATLLLPITNMANGEIRGILNVFQLQDRTISDALTDTAREAARLASLAVSRAMVLEKALTMASSDELTGLINRRGFYQRFESELERARRHQTPLCITLVDVDHFKRFNDTYGHLSGDLILQGLASLFSGKMRKSDVICRFGGEEFAILLPDTSLKSAAELMERVRQNVEEMTLSGFNGERLQVTISVGLTAVNTRPKAGPRQSEISEALAIADEQLYLAKRQGKNQVCFREIPLATEQAADITQPTGQRS